MKFTTLLAENAYSFKKLDFKFNYRGTTLIAGRSKDENTSNGAGKSSLIKILYLGLWGKELNAAPLDKVIHQDSDNGYLIEVHFEDKGHLFKIVRFRSRKEREIATGVDFFIDGKIFNGENASDTQKIIESKLNISPRLFLSAIMTKQNSQEHFLTASDTDKKEIFSELLDLTIYSKSFDTVKKEIEALEENLGQVSDKIENLNERIKERRAEISDLEIKEDSFEDEKITQYQSIEEKRKAVQVEIQKIKESNSELASLREQEIKFNENLELLKKTKTKLLLELEEETILQEFLAEYQAEVSTIEKKESSFQNKLELSSQELSKLKKRKESPTELEKKIDRLKEGSTRVSAIVETLDKHKEPVKDLTLAANDVSSQFATTNEARIKELESLKEEYEITLEEIAKIKTSSVERKTATESALKKLRGNKDLIRKNDESAETLRKKIKTIQDRKNSIANIDIEINAKNQLVANFDSQIEEIKAKKNPYKDLISPVHKKMDELIQLLEQNKKVAVAYEDELRYLSFWKGAFSPLGIRSFIFDEVIDLLNQKVQENLNDLIDGAINVVFESESKNSKGSMNNKIGTNVFFNGRERDFNLLSGGQQRRAILAVNLALTQIAESYSGTVMNIKFLDEPFEGIDSQGQQQCFKIFSRLSQNKDGFFVISHDPSFQDLCPNAIYIVKEKGESRLVSREEFSPTGNLDLHSLIPSYSQDE